MRKLLLLISLFLFTFSVSYGDLNNDIKKYELEITMLESEKQLIEANISLIRDKYNLQISTREKEYYIEQQRRAWEYNKLGLSYNGNTSGLEVEINALRNTMNNEINMYSQKLVTINNQIESYNSLIEDINKKIIQQKNDEEFLQIDLSGDKAFFDGKIDEAIKIYYDGVRKADSLKMEQKALEYRLKIEKINKSKEIQQKLEIQKHQESVIVSDSQKYLKQAIENFEKGNFQEAEKNLINIKTILEVNKIIDNEIISQVSELETKILEKKNQIFLNRQQDLKKKSELVFSQIKKQLSKSSKTKQEKTYNSLLKQLETALPKLKGDKKELVTYIIDLIKKELEQY